MTVVRSVSSEVSAPSLRTRGTLTQQQIEQLMHGNTADQAYARQYVLNALNHAPAFGTVPGLSGPGGVAGALDQGISAVPDAVQTAGKTVVSITDAVSYVVTNAKYAGIWVGLMILGITLLTAGLRASGIQTPSIPRVIPV